MQKWEYLQVLVWGGYAFEANGRPLGNQKDLFRNMEKGDYPGVESFMSKVGGQCWEMVASVPSGGKGDHYSLFFKRPRQE